MMTELANEKELAERASKDAEAFAALYDFYFPKIWAYTIRRVGHTETAEDIVSQIFLKITEALPRRKNNAPFGAWVFRIATNAIIDHYRTSGRRREEEIVSAETIPEHGSGPDEFAEARMMFGEIEKILAALPERDRRCLHLKFFAGLSNSEIAEIEKVKEGNVAIIVHRALIKIRENSKFYGKQR
jgi:RNA polymerase sigma-70 factor, ECF subfamily